MEAGQRRRKCVPSNRPIPPASGALFRWTIKVSIPGEKPYQATGTFYAGSMDTAWKRAKTLARKLGLDPRHRTYTVVRENR